MAKKKFDTNPLDPDFPEKLKEAETVGLPKNTYQTAEFPPSAVTEEQTQRFDNQDFNAYQSPYNGQQVPADYRTVNFADFTNVSDRKVAKTGIPEKWLTGLSYVPWYIGLVAALIILFIVPKSETKVRFHAAQGLAAHLAILLITTVLAFIGYFSDFADLGNMIFQIVTFIMLITFAIKAWMGKPVHIESVDDLTNWLEEKTKPVS